MEPWERPVQELIYDLKTKRLRCPKHRDSEIEIGSSGGPKVKCTAVCTATADCTHSASWDSKEAMLAYLKTLK